MSEEDDLPGDAEANPLALRSNDTQLDVGRPGNRLVSRAAIDALASLQSLSDKRWQVGEFELREQDYRQLQIWLEHLNERVQLGFSVFEDGVWQVIARTSLDIVIVGANSHVSKTWYAKAWNKDAEPTTPDCYSLNGITPMPDSTMTQNDLCASCSKNPWSSKVAEQGQELKACADQKRLVIVPADSPSGTVYLLQVTPDALKGLHDYQKQLSSAGFPAETVKTRISFDTEASYPKLTFGFAGFLSEDAQNQVDALLGTERVMKILGESVPDSEISMVYPVEVLPRFNFKKRIFEKQRLRAFGPDQTKGFRVGQLIQNVSFLNKSSSLGFTLDEFALRALQWPSGFFPGQQKVLNGRILVAKLDSGCAAELDLSNVPELSVLSCCDNELSKIDLSMVPKLKQLFCTANQLSDLDLSNVPQLTKLICNVNQLKAIDLSNVPHLNKFACDMNQLTELDLSSVPALTSLRCHENQLTELDIRNCPNLLNITCDPGVLVRKRSDQSVERIG